MKMKPLMESWRKYLTQGAEKGKKFEYVVVRNHFLQGNVYAHILNTEYNYKIHTVVILYVFRNLRQIVPFDLPIDPPLAQSLLERAPILRNSIDKKIVPDPIGSNISHCQWCSYKKYCEKDKCNEILQPFNKKKKEKKVEVKKKEVKATEPPQKKGAFIL